MLIVSRLCPANIVTETVFFICLRGVVFCILSFSFNLYADTDASPVEQVGSSLGNVSKRSYGSSFKVSEEKAIQFSRVLNQASRLKATNTERARRYAQEVFDSAKNDINEEYQAKALIVLGQISKVDKDYKKAQQFFQYAFTLAAQLDSTELAIETLLNTSEVQRLMKRYEEARNSVDNAQKLAVEQSNQEFLIRCYTTLGNISLSQNNYESAFSSYNSALSLSQSYGDDEYLISAHKNIAKTYAGLEKFNSAIFHNQQALEIIEAAPKAHSKDVALQLELIASHQRRLGDFLPALKNARRALVIQRKNKNLASIEKLLLALAIIHRKLGSYDYALRYGTELLSIAIEREDHNQILSANNELALIYTQLIQYKNAEEFYKKTLAQFERKTDSTSDQPDLRYKAAALRGLASVYTKLARHEDALVFANHSLSIYKSLNRVSGSEAASRLIGQIYFRQGMHDEAIEAFELALSQARSTGARWSESSNLVHLGEVLLKKNQREKAKEVILEGLLIAEDISAKSLALMAYKSLMNMELENNNYKLAFNYLLQQHEIVRERSDDEVSQRIAELEILREMDLQERRIDILERQSRIDSLELDRKNSELNVLAQQNTIKALELEKEKTIRMLFIFGLVLCFLLLALIFGCFIYSRKVKKVSPICSK